MRICGEVDLAPKPIALSACSSAGLQSRASGATQDGLTGIAMFVAHFAVLLLEVRLPDRYAHAHLATRAAPPRTPMPGGDPLWLTGGKAEK